MWLVNESFCTELALFVLVLFWTESASVVFELACAVSVLFELELWYELLEIVKMFWKKSALFVKESIWTESVRFVKKLFLT